MNAVQELLNFVNSPKAAPSQSLAGAISQIGPLRLRLVAIKLFSWLKLQRKLNKPLPFSLDDRYEWSRDLERLISNHDFLGGLIVIEGRSVIIAPNLSTVERDKFLEIVDVGHEPRLMKRVVQSN
jgi:hypothetical protein